MTRAEFLRRRKKGRDWMENVPLPVIADLSEQDRLDAFPMPQEGPMWWRVGVDRRECNFVCGKCLRVIGEGMTLLDVFEFARHTARYLIRCSCGAHVQVPAQRGGGQFSLYVEGPDRKPALNRELFKPGRRQSKRPEPRLAEPPR
jgi:hypothetical protein